MRRHSLLLWLVGWLVSALAGCSLMYKAPPVEKTLRITAPQDETVVFVGQPVRFAVHMANMGMPATGTLFIDGPREDRLGLDFTARGRDLLVAEVVWVPEAEGRYQAWVEAQLADGSQRRGNNRVHFEARRPRPIQAPTQPAGMILLSPTPLPLVSPTLLPSPTATVLQTPTATPRPCYMARFVADVTVPDGTPMQPGQQFTKTWRLQNVGSCTWMPDYTVVFTSGNRMNAPAAQPLGHTVAPGQMVDVSVSLVAPQNPGTYQANFKLRSTDGTVFGLGQRQAAFYVRIQVVGLADLVVRSVQFSPDPYVIGQPAKVTVVVANQGQGPADPFGVAWLVHKNARASSCGWQVSGLAAGQSTTLTCTLSGNEYATPGDYPTLTIVDVGNKVRESHEDNNQFVQTYRVVSGDTTGPGIKASASSNKIYWPAGCVPGEVTITAYVSDPSGVASVQVQYRVINQNQVAGRWVTRAMNQVAPQKYQVVLTGADLQASLDPPIGAGQGRVEYRIVAQDTVGNTSRAEQPPLTLYYCLY